MDRSDLNGSSLPAGATQLSVDHVDLPLGGVRALDNVSLRVRQGDIHAVIGPNGAGKSTLFNCISGFCRPQRGSVVLDSGDGLCELTRTRPSRIARLGVARTFQSVRCFEHMTVLDSLLLGRHMHMRHRVLASLAPAGSVRDQEIRHREFVEAVIAFLGMEAVRGKQVGSLAYGVQKRVEFGRVLCMRPSVLLLDEPMAGLSTRERQNMVQYVLDVNEYAGITIVLIEHDMRVVTDLCDRVTVLDSGRVIAEGPPAQIVDHPDVISTYLGSPRPAAQA
ncbi:ABC transporter ATP-binding protein [Streptomyces sp. NPDC005529]|uniref:ABC transporter ATP-binding protein n=1 Tax=unclassified Streptomyces TaxID=2593676 RepID=UPI0033A2F399